MGISEGEVNEKEMGASAVLCSLVKQEAKRVLSVWKNSRGTGCYYEMGMSVGS